jgi:gas vesicle protein
MFVGLALMSFYILGSRDRTTGSISIATNSTDAHIPMMKPDLRYTQLEEKIDTLFLLLQNQMNPIISNLKNQGEKLQELEQALQTKTESSPALLQALVALNEELDTKIKQMGEKVMGLSQRSTEDIESLKGELSDSLNEKLEQSVGDAIQKAFMDLVSENPTQFNDQKAALLSFLESRLLQYRAPSEADSMYIFKTFGPDYSLKTSGASIVTQNTSPSYLQDKDVFVKGLHKVGSPLEILDPSIEPGHCWGMKGGIV